MPLYTMVRVEQLQKKRSVARSPRRSSASDSIPLRARYNSRSRASPVRPSGLSRNTCLMRGWVIFAKRPTTLWSTGTSRHATSLRPSFLATSSMRAIDFFSASSSLGRKTMPTPVVSGFSSGISFLKKSHGIWVITPAPSPESLSALHAPRCSMHPSACSDLVTTSWVATLFRDAIKPTPQASRSLMISFMSAMWTSLSLEAEAMVEVLRGRLAWLEVGLPLGRRVLSMARRPWKALKPLAEGWRAEPA
mmetsp:Transcript_24635/g.63128  ORF Transcript_24635/g.63128 Transcript_24635/m.63128 type:complete len:249 (+) Transcript_24635:167-913(+)